jgi:endonuclease/exonuclease/phosphatase family metal-dependent hydrolase
MGAFFRVNAAGKTQPTLLGKVTTGVAAALSAPVLALGAADALNPAPLGRCDAPIPAAAVSDFVDGPNVSIITDNTASGNVGFNTKVNQADIIEQPFYQDVIEGRPNAPIISAQEVGPAQFKAIGDARARTHNFQIIEAKTKPGQGNLLLIPDRYEIQDSVVHRFINSQVQGGLETVGDFISGETPFKASQDLAGLFSPRAYAEARLTDRATGQTLTVFGGHLASAEPKIRLAQAEELMSAVEKAKTCGPVAVAFDMNTATASSERVPENSDHVNDHLIRDVFAKAGLIEAGPVGPTSRARPRRIDQVLVAGMDPVSSHVLVGTEDHIPGFPTAESISDHNPLQVTLKDPRAG